MQDLPLQVADVDGIEVDDADGADARGREIQRRRRTEAPGADTEHAAGLEPALAVRPHLGQDQVPAVALHFGVGQLGQRVGVATGAPPATDGTMLTTSPAFRLVASLSR